MFPHAGDVNLLILSDIHSSFPTSLLSAKDVIKTDRPRGITDGLKKMVIRVWNVCSRLFSAALMLANGLGGTCRVVWLIVVLRVCAYDVFDLAKEMLFVSRLVETSPEKRTRTHTSHLFQ